MYIKELDLYLTAKGYSKTYIEKLKSFLIYCNENKINILNISYDNLNNFICELLTKKKSKGYINTIITAIKFYYKFLVDTNKTPENILDTINKLKNLKTTQKIKEFMTKEELINLVGMGMSFYERFNPIKIKVICYFLFYTGVRKQEFLNLKRKDIDLKELSVKIKAPTKNKEERIVFFTKKVGGLIKDYYLLEPKETINAFNTTNSDLISIINNVRDFLPNKHLSIHTFRHSFANMLINKGVDIRIIQKLLGHKDLSSTLIYCNPDINTIKKIYKEKIK